MAGAKPDVLLVGKEKSVIMEGLASKVKLHKLIDAKDKDAFIKSIADKIGAIAVTYTNEPINAEFMQRFPKLEQVSSFGVGYDHVDAKWAGAHGIVVTNTPEVLNEEVADTALGLLLCTVRELPANGTRRSIRSPRRPCEIAPSAWSAWAASARPSRAGSMPSACRWSITRATRKAA